MRFLRQNGKPQVDFFKDDTFADFRSSLDGEMKRLQAKGVGSRGKQAEPLTADEEEMLWNKKVLGATILRHCLTQCFLRLYTSTAHTVMQT